MAASYVRGIQSQGIYACPKHFAVNSQELRRMAMNSVLDERTLREIYLTGFEIAIKEGKAKSIMTSYNEVNGVYANENERRNFEYFSEDPYLAGKMAASYVRGIQSQGIYACPKHFAVNSQELRRMAMNSVLDERTLREIYLTGFEIAIKEGKAKSIMTSYNEVNGVYANENEHLLKEILREEWGFDGLVCK